VDIVDFFEHDVYGNVFCCVWTGWQ